MCGIVGVIGGRAAVSIILDGLHRVEYRGYDSAGIATLVEGRIERRRAPGKLAELEDVLGRLPLAGTIGIGAYAMGHARRPTEINAHPTAPRGSASCITASSRTTPSCAPSSRRRARCFRPKPTLRRSCSCSTCTCSTACTQ